MKNAPLAAGQNPREGKKKRRCAMKSHQNKKTRAALAALLAALVAAGLPNTGWAQKLAEPGKGKAKSAVDCASMAKTDAHLRRFIAAYKAAPTTSNKDDVKTRAFQLGCAGYNYLAAPTAAASQFPVYFDGALAVEQLFRHVEVALSNKQKLVMDNPLSAMALFTATIAVSLLPPSIQAAEKAELTNAEKLSTINPRLRRLAGRGNLNLAKRISDLVDAKSSQVAADLKAVFDPSYKGATRRFLRERADQLKDAAFLIAAEHAYLKLVGCKLKNGKTLQAAADKADGLVKDIAELSKEPAKNASALEAKWAELVALLEKPTKPGWGCNNQDLLYQVGFEQALKGVEPRDKAVAETYLAKAKGVSSERPDMRLRYVWAGLSTLPKAYLAFLTDPTRGLPLADVSKETAKWKFPTVVVTGKGAVAMAPGATRAKDGAINGKDAFGKDVSIPATDGAVVLQHPAAAQPISMIGKIVGADKDGARSGWLAQLRLDAGYSLAIGITTDDDAEVKGTGAHIVRVGLSYLIQVVKDKFFITPYLHGGVMNVQGDSVFRTEDMSAGERAQALLALGTKLGWNFEKNWAAYAVGEGLFFPGRGGSVGAGFGTSALKYLLADFDIRYMGMPDTGVSSGKYWGQPRENIGLNALMFSLTLSL